MRFGRWNASPERILDAAIGALALAIVLMILGALLFLVVQGHRGY